MSNLSIGIIIFVVLVLIIAGVATVFHSKYQFGVGKSIGFAVATVAVILGVLLAAIAGPNTFGLLI